MISQEVSGLLSESLLHWKIIRLQILAANYPRLSTSGGNNPGAVILYIKQTIGIGALSVHFNLRSVPHGGSRMIPAPARAA